jgi:hypothetical protein
MQCIDSDLQSLIEIIQQKQINTIFVSDSSAQTLLSKILPQLSNQTLESTKPLQQHPIVWIHSRSAGIDSYMSPELMEWYQHGTMSSGSVDADTIKTTATTTSSYNTVQMTNARGMFSSTLAEYSIGACTYFSKDFHRLKRNQKLRAWEKYVY